MKPHLVAYLHLRQNTPQATRLLLTDYITGYAERNGYELVRLFTGIDGPRERITVGAMCREIARLQVGSVLVAGDNPYALALLNRMPSVKVFRLPTVQLSAVVVRQRNEH